MASIPAPHRVNLELRPVTIRQASAFVVGLHRHHKPPQGARFALGAFSGPSCVGVVIVGNPVARKSADGLTAEVTRLCTNGHPNACSFLYAAARRVCQTMGYRRVLTFILNDESGVSLKAAGWVQTGTTPGNSWSVPSRPRSDKHPIGPKKRFEAADCAPRRATA